jgi:ABC-2 type transport system permease protein
MTATVMIALLAGAFIYYQEYVVDAYTKPKEFEKKTADYEKKYKKYEKMPQPRITAVNVQVDLFTRTRTMHAKGRYMLKNKTAMPVEILYIDYPGGEKSSFKFTELKPGRSFKVLEAYQEFGIRILQLDNPLMPGDSMPFDFEMDYAPLSFYYRSGSMVNGNGTFINNSIFPTIGYKEENELSENTARQEYGLPPRPRLARVDDPVALQNNYISNDADWIDFEATVSTDDGQIAIAPGYLQKQWTEKGRRYFHYKMDSPMLNFYSFLSARYEVRRDKWKDVNIEVFYHKGHEYNVDRMIRSIKRSFDYYTVNFGPYQHKQARIIEFPRYASFAQSFPNTIPYSEAIGFILKVEDDPEKIDLPFYVTAHEIAHQWWAHQVIGGNVQGKELMSETLCQYSALMVMEKEYGKEAMKKFLKREMDDYLQGRASESKGELPLMLVEQQQYIYYNKGSVVMYALKDFIGEDKLNTAIRAYLDKTRFSGPPYTNSIEFVNYIKQATPDSLQYLVTDLFEKITIYENYVAALDYKKLSGNAYKVTLKLGSAKYYNDSLGNRTKSPVNDYMDVGIFASDTIKGKAKERILLMQRIKMDQPEKTFEFIVKDKPASAGVDPYLKLVDRKPDNNNCAFGKKPVIPNLDAKNEDLMFNVNLGGE